MTMEISKRGQFYGIALLVFLIFVFVLTFIIFSLGISSNNSGNDGDVAGTELVPFDSETYNANQLSALIGEDKVDCRFAPGSGIDSDDDGIVDSCDNCPLAWNPDQEDNDFDGEGDACDSGGSIDNGDDDDDDDDDIRCFDDLDCGTDGFSGGLSCSDSGDVTQNYRDYTCVNPGTESSFCRIDNEIQTKEMCEYGCTNGMCNTPEIRCSFDFECNDNNQYTIDTCENPGTPASRCTYQGIACLFDSDCGTEGPIGPQFCSATNDDILQEYYVPECLNSGSAGASCNPDTQTQVVGSCPYACLDGGCIRCDENSDCSDGDSSTQDICNLAGTSLSFCTNPDVPECTPGSSRQCGSTDVGLCRFGFESCTSQGEWSGVCVGNVEPASEQCDGFDNDCDGQSDEGGVCEVTPVCGNGILELGEQCDDGNNANGDGCSSSCQIEITECTPGETRQCGSTDVGLCSFGVETCDAWGEWSGECVGEVTPAGEMCDGFDNDCDGVADEGNICETACNDGVDNDGDNLVDMEDPSCDSPMDDSEDPFDMPACSDGLDNDGDGLFDFPSDPECDSLIDNDEAN